MCDRVLVIKKGKLIASGTIAEIAHRGSYYEIAVPDVGRASAALRALPGVTEIREAGSALEVVADAGRGAELNRALASAGSTPARSFRARARSRMCSSSSPEMVMLQPLRSEVYRLRRRWMPYVMLACHRASRRSRSTSSCTSPSRRSWTAIENGTIPSEPAQEAGADADAVARCGPTRCSHSALDIVGGLASLMLIVFAASHVGTEFNWGTLRTLLAHGASRGGFLAAKLLSIAPVRRPAARGRDRGGSRRQPHRRRPISQAT